MVYYETITQRPLRINRSGNELVLLSRVTRSRRVVERICQTDGIGVLDVQQQVKKDGLACLLVVSLLLSQCGKELTPSIRRSVHIQLVHHHRHECLVLAVIPHVRSTRCHTLLSVRTLPIGNHEAINHCLVRVVYNQVTPTAHRVVRIEILCHESVFLHEGHRVRIHPATHSSTRHSSVHSVITHSCHFATDSIANHAPSIDPERHCLPCEECVAEGNHLPRVTTSLFRVVYQLHPLWKRIPVIFAIGDEPIRFHLLLHLVNRLEVSEQLLFEHVTDTEVDVEIGGVGISQHHRVQRVERAIGVVVTRSSHHQHVRELLVEHWNVSCQHEGRQALWCFSIIDVVGGDVVVQPVEWNGVNDVVVVVLYWSAFPIRITILPIDTKVLQGDGL